MKRIWKKGNALNARLSIKEYWRGKEVLTFKGRIASNSLTCLMMILISLMSLLSTLEKDCSKIKINDLYVLNENIKNLK